MISFSSFQSTTLFIAGYENRVVSIDLLIARTETAAHMKFGIDI